MRSATGHWRQRPGAVILTGVDALDRWRTHLSRVEVAPGLDAFTALLLAVFALAALAAVVAWVISAVRRARSPEGIDIDRELGLRKSGIRQLADPRMGFLDKLKFAVIGVFIIGVGLNMLISGHSEGYSHATHYSADGPPVRFAGGLLLFSVALAAAAFALKGRAGSPPSDE